jgi:hypothetical protein
MLMLMLMLMMEVWFMPLCGKGIAELLQLCMCTRSAQPLPIHSHTRPTRRAHSYLRVRVAGGSLCLLVLLLTGIEIVNS